MKLSRRLWLWGAVLPVVVLASILFVADQLFHAALLRSLDQALLAQAAVESVSLFDGPHNEPHLHMASSPLVDSVRPFAPEGVLFGPDGLEVMRYPPPVSTSQAERLPPGDPAQGPRLSTQEEPDRRRVLVVSLDAPSKARYALRLSAPLGLIDRSAETFHLVAIVSTLATAVLLLVIQGVQGRSLRGRLSAVSGHLEALRAGRLEQRLPPDDEADELSEVRDVLGKTTEQLLLARDSRERLLANAAHELRTPLTVMRTRLDLALRRERSPEDLKVALSETREEVVRLSTLAGRLLDTAARARAPLETAPVDLVPLAKDALRAIEASPRGLSGVLEAPETLTVNAHAESVRQALDNLLSNAVKFAPDGSTIALTINPLDAGARLAVRDRGPGIPVHEREAVFEPFHRVRGGPPGTGLGLAIVREVARHHQGRAFVADTEQGAEVVLELGGASSRA